MTQSWFRMDVAGNVVGVSESDLATAEMNLSEGQYLLPADPAVNPRRDWWTGEGWEPKPAPPRPEDDYRFMRRGGFPEVGEQLGALIKVVAALLSGEPVTPSDRAEFDAIVNRIQAVKAANPKT